MIELQPPKVTDSPSILNHRMKIFLAGTIDMGNSVNWQKKFLDDNKHIDAVAFNPRRNDWDSSWEQSIHDPNFRGQVNWELDHLDKADVILFNFVAGSQSPVTLAELGLHLPARDGRLLVCCPHGFYRKGNVDIMCYRFGVPVYEKMDELNPIVRYLSYEKSRKINANKKVTGQYTTGL